ncbi:transposable element Tc3 transposase [Trichonephila clavipes]|nr:transposable element Tc3 transposase [Trichonephila clavipes]
MLGRRIAVLQPPPTCLPELRRALLDEWCNILQDQIDNLILIMPRRCKHLRQTDTQTDLLCAVLPFDMATLNHENSPTWDGVEPAKLGAEGQRETNYAIQPSCLRPRETKNTL